MEPLREKRVSRKTADSNPKPSVEGLAHPNVNCGLPDLKSIRHDKLVQQEVKECLRQLSDLDKKMY